MEVKIFPRFKIDPLFAESMGSTTTARDEACRSEIMYSAFGKSLCTLATVRRFGCQYQSCH
jgi:hypothetical protein